MALGLKGLNTPVVSEEPFFPICRIHYALRKMFTFKHNSKNRLWSFPSFLVKILSKTLKFAFV